MVLTEQDAELYFDTFIEHFDPDKPFKEYREEASLENSDNIIPAENALKYVLYMLITKYLQKDVAEKDKSIATERLKRKSVALNVLKRSKNVIIKSMVHVGTSHDPVPDNITTFAQLVDAVQQSVAAAAGGAPLPTGGAIPDDDVPGLDNVSPNDPHAPEKVSRWFNRRNQREAGSGMWAQLREWIRRGHQVYAFTWWMFPEDSYKKVENEHIYPRMRGDFRANFTENPNKDIFRYISEDVEFEEAHAKADGNVEGKYLGYMGLSHKVPLHPVLENRHDGGQPGRLVEPIEVPEGWVIGLGVAHAQLFDILRMKMNGISRWHFDWAQLTWKWHKWDGGAGDNKTEVKVRVVQWNDENDEGYVKQYLREEHDIDLTYNELVKAPQEYAEQLTKVFDTEAYKRQDLGLEGAEVFFQAHGEAESMSTTERHGYVSKKRYEQGTALQISARMDTFGGLELGEYKYAKRGALVVPVEAEERQNDETMLPHRYFKVKLGENKTLIILRTKTVKSKPHPLILVKPMTNGEHHEAPLDGKYASTTPHKYKKGKEIKGDELSFRIQKNYSKPVMKDNFCYFLFVAQKNGAEWQPVDIHDSNTFVQVRYMTNHKPNKFVPGLNNQPEVVKRRGRSMYYWDSAKRNEDVTFTLNPKSNTEGHFRIYCLAVKHHDAAMHNAWETIRATVLADVGIPENHAYLWDFNYIDFTYGDVQATEEPKVDLEKAFSKFSELGTIMKDENFENRHTLDWIKKKDYLHFVELYKYIRELLKRHSILRKNLSMVEREKFFRIMTVIYFIIATYQNTRIKKLPPDEVRKELGGIISKEAGEGAGREFGQISAENEAVAKEYLHDISSELYAKDLEWLLEKMKTLLHPVIGK